MNETTDSNASVGGIKTSSRSFSQGAACGTLLYSHRQNPQSGFYATDSSIVCAACGGMSEGVFCPGLVNLHSLYRIFVGLSNYFFDSW